MSNAHFWLSEAQFERLAPLLPTDTRGKPRVDDRRVISGIIHVLKSGCRWKDAPEAYGPHKTLYNRFVRWAAKGVWVDVFHALAAAGGPPAAILIDSSAVKAHRCAAGG
ncbi:IS5 family transposase, partial [Acuticoccus sp. M5D2P5]|uniref:IS5 family transposase n=1 Tax=Acuticoccus kalidii TaxID=2910977 RepID=UPI001F27E7FB